MNTGRCAQYWRLTDTLRTALHARGGKKTNSYQKALQELRSHLSVCPECRAWFDDVPAEGKAAAEINPDL